MFWVNFSVQGVILNPGEAFVDRCSHQRLQLQYQLAVWLAGRVALTDVTPTAANIRDFPGVTPPKGNDEATDVKCNERH